MYLFIQFIMEAIGSSTNCKILIIENNSFLISSNKCRFVDTYTIWIEIKTEYFLLISAEARLPVEKKKYIKFLLFAKQYLEHIYTSNFI